jgi:hypothetical protein
MESIHSCLNFIFDVDIVYLRLIILLVVDGILVDNETVFDRLRESQDQPDLVFQICF